MSSTSATPDRQIIHVAAGALVDPDGRVLIARRPPGVHQGGLWEFPGGKLEPGEAPSQGLARELHEELGIQVRRFRPLIRVHHDYGDRHVRLDVYRVDAFEGDPVGREGQPLAWVRPDDMDAAGFPAADRPIISALRLPSRYLITGDDPRDPAAFAARLDRALAAGIRIVQLRAHALSDRDYGRLAERLYPICRAAGARLLLNRDWSRDPALAATLPGDGVHLSARMLQRLQTRPVAADRLVGASCHSAAELALAQRLQLDYALLSPVLPTRSHPGAATLGWAGFSALVEPVGLPVYALGGLGPQHLAISHASGAQGIAAISGLWSADAEGGVGAVGG
ncbi:Nudix family hydrolase [Thiohalocapsa marina]|uniref:8-oxo-dGTP diphosphatase n=1 Tax=Thiohalocapsa marina TaxID=424902 RepID=A0A5M8FQ24_9GAMM|nr:Nudix family hydrolase [Thiohalocapsa marina]KAA6186614.1 Nudix family hydrolase [Thiohalocapsa marina]